MQDEPRADKEEESGTGLRTHEDKQARAIIDQLLQCRPVVLGDLPPWREGILLETDLGKDLVELGHGDGIAVGQQHGDDLIWVVLHEVVHRSQIFFEGAGIELETAGVAHFDGAVQVVRLSLQEAHAQAQLLLDRVILVLRWQLSDEGGVMRS